MQVWSYKMKFTFMMVLKLSFMVPLFAEQITLHFHFTLRYSQQKREASSASWMAVDPVETRCSCGLQSLVSFEKIVLKVNNGTMQWDCASVSSTGSQRTLNLLRHTLSARLDPIKVLLPRQHVSGSNNNRSCVIGVSVCVFRVFELQPEGVTGPALWVCVCVCQSKLWTCM